MLILFYYRQIYVDICNFSDNSSDMFPEIPSINMVLRDLTEVGAAVFVPLGALQGPMNSLFLLGGVSPQRHRRDFWPR